MGQRGWELPVSGRTVGTGRCERNTSVFRSGRLSRVWGKCAFGNNNERLTGMQEGSTQELTPCPEGLGR